MAELTPGELRAIAKMTPFYVVEIRYSDEDKGYISTVSALPGCSAFGETRREAAAEIEDAMVAWIAAQQAAGNPIPRAD